MENNSIEHPWANGSLVGMAMKEMVRRAMVHIHKYRFKFETYEKPGQKGRMDFCTTADKEAQRSYLKVIRENFPGVGVIAEEDNLSIPCTLCGYELYISVDPLDGTRAFKRFQSSGIGTMVAFIDKKTIVAACVGDVLSEDIYYYRPGSKKTHRLWKLEKACKLEIDTRRPLSSQYVLLRSPVAKHSSFAQTLLTVDRGSLFRTHEIARGSIGSSMARLWKGEVSGAILSAGSEHPWDYLPILGLCQQLGFVFLDIDTEHKKLTLRKPTVSLKAMVNPFERLVVHRSRLQELTRWMKKNHK